MIGFLDSLFYTSGELARNLFVAVLSIQGVAGVIRRSHGSDWFIDKLETLTNDQVTNILSVPDAFYEIFVFFNRLIQILWHPSGQYLP